MGGEPELSATVAPMPRPISGRQLDKLGDRLRLPGPISDADYEMLTRGAEAYQAVLYKVEERLQALDFEATTRVKTTRTLVDKLRRTPQLPLKSIHDVAGARIVIDGGRLEKDQVTERILAAFRDCPKAPQLIDRREQPSYGYRAVHVVVFVDSTPVEIQIRTKLQDMWAQISEKLGDLWGRGLRYGQGPDMPDALADPAGKGGITRRELVTSLGTLADSIATMEDRERMLAVMLHELHELENTLAEAKAGAQVSLEAVLKFVGAQGGGAQ